MKGQVSFKVTIGGEIRPSTWGLGITYSEGLFGLLLGPILFGVEVHRVRE